MITQSILKAILIYNPLTGEFVWKNRDVSQFINSRSCNAWNSRNAGKKAGCISLRPDGKRYISITVNGKTIAAHRLAWLYITGSFPPFHIDHIDGDGTNNKWCNLRSVTPSENQRNMRLSIKNRTGVSGVSWESKRLVWHVRISRQFIGYYSDKFEAICARKSAELKNNYHENHGQLRPL